MKMMGLDISSNSTGWCIVDYPELKLVEYGLIKPDGNMGVTQRLYFFGNEIKKLIDKFQPTEIAIEETILVRGPKIMRTLARFSGVALYIAYCYQKHEISMYEPSMWKKGIGLKGHAEKPEIQLKVCEVFNLIEPIKIENYRAQFNEIFSPGNKQGAAELKDLEAKYLETLASIKLLNKEMKQGIKQKISDLSDVGMKIRLASTAAEEIKQKLKEAKKNSRGKSKDMVKQIVKISTDIYSDSGVNSDVADSVGVAIMAINEKK